MDTKYEIQLFVTGGNVDVEIKRYYVFPNGAHSPAQTWRKAFTKGDSIGETLPCIFEGDTEQTPVSLAEMFPAEYAYLKVKFGV